MRISLGEVRRRCRSTPASGARSSRSTTAGARRRRCVPTRPRPGSARRRTTMRLPPEPRRRWPGCRRSPAPSRRRRRSRCPRRRHQERSPALSTARAGLRRPRRPARASSVGTSGGRDVNGARVDGSRAAVRGDRRDDAAQALLALARAGAEAGVALHLLEVGVAEPHRMLDVGQRDVLAAAEDHLAGHALLRFLLLGGAGLVPPGLGGSNILSSIGSSKVTP